MTDKILSYLKRMRSLLPQKLNRYHYLAVFVFFLTVGFFGLTQSVGAWSIMGEIADGFLHFFTWLMLIVADLCIGLTIFFLRFFISIAAYNNYIDVDVVQLGWIMIRDVANMFFVVALLVIAFGTILGIEEYEWKKNLVKLILAAILINFSNLIAQLIIDMAHVFTITFLNAIAATAGGNIINMFKLDQITQMVGAAGENAGDFRMEMAAGAIAATGFAVLAAVAMGSYAYVMMVRVVVLWGLIILAPGAYILGVLPKTKAYADRWWSEFGKHVVVAPVMVFFLWLSFATLGNGQIAQDIQNNQNEQFLLTQTKYEANALKKHDDPKLSLSKVTTWENMASFFIAMAFMYYGLKVTQETGATGAGAVGSALEFGKKVATMATGYAAARWLAGGAVNLAKKGGMGVLKGAGWAAIHAPGLNIADRANRFKEYFQMQWQSWEGWKNEVGGERIKKEFNDKGELVAVMKKTEKRNADGSIAKDEAGNAIMIDSKIPETENYELGWLQRQFQKNVIKNAESKKRLEKTEKFAENRKEMMDKSTKGIPSGWFSGGMVDAEDRFERGRLKAMQERSAAKTEEYEGLGAKAEREGIRDQNIVEHGTILGLFGKKVSKASEVNARLGKPARDLTVGEEIEAHKVRAETIKKQSEEKSIRDRKKFMADKGKGAVEARMRAELTIKALQGETKKIEEQARFGMAKQDIEVAKETKSKIDKLIEQVREKNPTMKTKDIVKSLVDDKIISATQAEQYTEGEGKGVVYRAAAAEKQAHTEEQKLKQLTTSKGVEYGESHHGQEELEEEAILGKQISTDEERIKELETEKNTELLDKGKKKAEKIAEVTGAIMDDVKTPYQIAAEQALRDAQEAVSKIEEKIKEEIKLDSKSSEDEGKTQRKILESELKKAKEEKLKLEKNPEYVAFNKGNQKEISELEKRISSEGTTDDEKKELQSQIDEIKKSFFTYEEGGVRKDSVGIEKNLKNASDVLSTHDTEMDNMLANIAQSVRDKYELALEKQGLSKKRITLEEINDEISKDPDQVARIKKAEEEAHAYEVAALGEEGSAGVALRYARQKQASATSKGAEEEEEKNLQHAALGLGIIQKLFGEEQAHKLGTEAADAFINKMKQEKIGELFKVGSVQLDEALEELKKGAKLSVAMKKVTSVGARNAFAQTVGSYYQENIAGISKTKATDAAEGLWSYDRTGNDTPATAFKKAVNKQNEVFAGVEKERAASLAVDSIKRINLMKVKGEKLDVDQEAKLMASVQFLTKNGWSDDALSRMVDIARSKNKQTYGSRAYEEAEAMENLLVDDLGWGTKDKNGSVKIKNESSEKRTNDFHRLMGFGSDVKMLHSENAVLLHQKYMEKTEGKVLSYEEAITDLHEKSGTEEGRKDLASKHAEIGKELGWDSSRINKQLSTFSKKFVVGGEEVGKALHRYTEEMKKYGDQAELLTEMKSAALATTHIDDAGHTIFDMDMGYARGQLSTDAMQTMLGDWIKVDGGTKLRNLKSHAIGYMDEDIGTLHRLDATRVNSTFQGVDSKVKLEAQDVRIQRQILKNSAREELRKDELTGAVVIGAADSVLVANKFKGNTEKAMKDVARDWAVLLKEAPKEFLAVSSMNSSVDFNEAQAKGTINMKVFGNHFTRMEQLVEWINANSGEAAEEDDHRVIEKLNAKAIIGGGKITKPRPGEEDEEERR